MLWIFFVIFIMLQKNAFVPKKFQFSCMGSKVPFWQFFNFFKMTLLNAWKHYFEAGVFYIKDSLFLDVISSEKNGRTLCYDITLCHALKTDLPCETRCLYKLLSIKYHWLNVPIFCRQYSTLSHGSGKYSEAKQIGSVQGRNHRENLVATSAMVVGRICSHCTEVRFASFLSGGFTTMAVMNPPEKKLEKRTSVHW